MDILTHGPTVVLVGDFNGRSTHEVRSALHEQLAEPEHAIVVDLTHVASIDVPAVLRMLHLTRLIKFVELERAAA